MDTITDLEILKKLDKIFARVKCNCGHYNKDHFGDGWCNKCGCTWYYPNDKWIMRMREKGMRKFSDLTKPKTKEK